jgi:hypothetical protein
MRMKRTKGLATTKTYTLRREDGLELKVFGELRNNRSIVLGERGAQSPSTAGMPSQTHLTGRGHRDQPLRSRRGRAAL